MPRRESMRACDVENGDRKKEWRKHLATRTKGINEHCSDNDRKE